jgi:RNA polymerase sigma-70 factor, ECF subfamily
LLIEARLVDRLYRQAKGERWRTPKDCFGHALESSAERTFAGRPPSSGTLERYLASLHLEDVALACACAAGDEPAWDHFVLTMRPSLYRAADALDASGGARDLADSLFADLFGLRPGPGERQSLFRYYHGRSSLTTWLRAVLAQRYVDRHRASRRMAPLPDETSPFALRAPAETIDPDRNRYLKLIRAAMKQATTELAARDRLRLACYYAQELTLAETGKVLGEHEATVSRALGRTRAAIRRAVERHLEAAGLTDAEIGRCFECVIEDAGPLNVHDMLESDPTKSASKEPAPDRSI